MTILLRNARPSASTRRKNFVEKVRAMLKFLGSVMLAVLLAGCAGSSQDSASSSFVSSGAEQSGSQSASGFAPTVSAEAGKLVPSTLVSASVEQRIPGSAVYNIGPFDVLEITVFKVPDLSKIVQVSEDGRFSYPLVGEVKASGRTAAQIEKDLAKQLGEKYLRNPQVTVFVKEYNSQRVTVDGAVKKPGVYPMRGNMSLIQAIAMSEGLDSLSEGTVIIFRQIDGRQAAARFNLNDVRQGKIDNPQLAAGDIVMVPTSEAKENLQNVLKVLPIVSAFAWL
ncbi:MAG: hypothetical protein B7Y70_07500 [Rhizobiales bacterium 35-68-8]|nr:MAG: hypothetical protein B7Y70_07500 [Rhizobiales bacterium 35-68-8]